MANLQPVICYLGHPVMPIDDPGRMTLETSSMQLRRPKLIAQPKDHTVGLITGVLTRRRQPR
jgi:hypothetical protein